MYVHSCVQFLDNADLKTSVMRLVVVLVRVPRVFSTVSSRRTLR